MPLSAAKDQQQLVNLVLEFGPCLLHVLEREVSHWHIVLFEVLHLASEALIAPEQAAEVTTLFPQDIDGIAWRGNRWSSCTRSASLSIPIAQGGDPTGRPTLCAGHDLHPDGATLRLPDYLSRNQQNVCSRSNVSFPPEAIHA